MSRRARRWLFGVLAVLALVVLAALAIVPGHVEEGLNVVTPGTERPVSPRARELHRRLLVADMHADTLLWARDPLDRAARGQVDVPRLLEGNVALQGFSVTTKSPKGLNVERNDDRSDDITLLTLVQRWPPRTWSSLLERALYQAQRLQRAADASSGRLRVIRNRDDLAAHLARRLQHPGATGGFLVLEGAHALEGDLANLDRLEAAGFRFIAPTHFFDTEWAGSAHGVAKGGLTDAGRALLHGIEEKRMFMDLAHASPATIRDVLALARRPVMVSHTGVKGTCDTPRNLSDEELRGIAGTGGVIGIGFWGGSDGGAVCGPAVADVVRAIRHAVTVAGIDHVGLGSDFDGAVTTPFDASGMAQLTEALLADGFSEAELTKVMGGNVLRVLASHLP